MNPEGLSSTREVLRPYPELKRLGLEFVSVTSSYPYGPYMGFPSYAHPIIPETEDADSLKESLNAPKYPHPFFDQGHRVFVTNNPYCLAPG